MAKTKALKLEHKKLRFIALMITPLLVALAFLLFSPVNTWGLEGDHRLKRNPGNQGWEQLKYLDVNFGETDSQEEDKKQ